MSDKYVSYVRKWNLSQWVTVKGRIEREDGIFSADDITIDDGEPVAADDFELWCKINGFTVSQLEHEKHRMIEDDVKSVGNAIQSVGETLAPAASLLWGAVINGSK